MDTACMYVHQDYNLQCMTRLRGLAIYIYTYRILIRTMGFDRQSPSLSAIRRTLTVELNLAQMHMCMKSSQILKRDLPNCIWSTSKLREFYKVGPRVQMFGPWTSLYFEILKPPFPANPRAGPKTDIYPSCFIWVNRILTMAFGWQKTLVGCLPCITFQRRRLYTLALRSIWSLPILKDILKAQTPEGRWANNSRAKSKALQVNTLSVQQQVGS